MFGVLIVEDKDVIASGTSAGSGVFHGLVREKPLSGRARRPGSWP